jgi:hypothetical protein
VQKKVSKDMQKLKDKLSVPMKKNASRELKN